MILEFYFTIEYLIFKLACSNREKKTVEIKKKKKNQQTSTHTMKST